MLYYHKQVPIINTKINTMPNKYKSPYLALATVLACGTIGGLLGYWLSSDVNNDAKILSAAIGAILGSLIPRSPVLTTYSYAAAAGFSVAATCYPLLLTNNAHPEQVLLTLLLAISGSASLNHIIKRLPKPKL
jgi:uncharacterized membrane protein YjjB (DUF3815 family)